MPYNTSAISISISSCAEDDGLDDDDVVVLGGRNLAPPFCFYTHQNNTVSTLTSSKPSQQSDILTPGFRNSLSSS